MNADLIPGDGAGELPPTNEEQRHHMNTTPPIPECFKDKVFLFSCDPDPVKLVGSAYTNGRLRLDLLTQGDFVEPFATITINLPDSDPGENKFFVRTWSGNEELIPELLASGVFIDTGRVIDGAHVWKFAKGRTVQFENGQALEDEVVQVRDGAKGQPTFRELKAKNVPLGVVAWQLRQPGLPYGERHLGARQQQAPVCPHCQAVTIFVRGDVIYPHRPDLAEKGFWQCAPCDAYVGCHDGTPEPLGTPANAELRKARSRAHGEFDVIWKEARLMSRGDAYAWLANKLGISIDGCHIGRFDLATCERVVEFAAELKRG